MQTTRIFSFLIVLTFILPMSVLAQRTKSLQTNSKGTAFGYFGYNRVAYTDGKLGLSSSGYDVTLSNVSFSDNGNYEGLKNYFSSEGLQNFQFNAHLGYFFRHKWAVTAGVDNYSIFMDSKQRITVDGTIAPGEHGILNNSSYESFVLNMEPKHFAYSQTTGFHVVRLGLLNSQQLYQTRDNKFAVISNVGGGFGLVVSNSDYKFGNFTHRGTSSVSGIAIVGNASARLVFVQHIFLQMGISGGLINHGSIQLNNVGDDIGKHRNGFLSPELSLGVNVFIRPTDGCGTCPQW